MRADAQPAGAVVDDDARVAAAPLRLLQVAARGEQRHDARPLSRRAAAEHFQTDAAGTLAQVIRYLVEPRFDGGYSDVEQQLQARAQAEDAGNVQRAALPA